MSRAHVVDDGRQGPLSAYLNRIDHYRLLTPAQERRLAMSLRRFRQRDAAAALGVSPTELENIESRITRRDMSLDDAAYVDTEETRGDRIADDRPGPEANFADEEVHHLAHDEIQRALDALDPRERDILN